MLLRPHPLCYPKELLDLGYALLLNIISDSPVYTSLFAKVIIDETAIILRDE